jgi:hypothetical protein
MKITFCLLLALCLSFGARAETTYVINTTGTYVASNRDMGLSSSTPQLTWITKNASALAQSFFAYAQPITGGVTVNGTVSISLSAFIDFNPANAAKTITLSAGYRSSGANTFLCSNSFTTVGNATQQTFTVTCSVASVAVPPNSNLVLQVAMPAITDTVYGESYQLLSGSGIYQTSIVWPQTMYFCATQGNACVCNGICNGASCGTQYSSAQTTSCSCDCTVAACTSLSIAGPSPLTCVDSLNASQMALAWGSVPGTANYTLSRGGTGVYTGAAASFTDAPGVGVYSYSVYANGSCTPAIGGTTLGSKNSQTTTNAACQVQANGSIIICQ